MFSSGSSFYDKVATAQAQAAANRAQSDADVARSETERLRHDVDRLLMITEALWSFLKKEHGYTDEELVKAVTDIDLRDGRLDGRAEQPKAAPCPTCGRVNSAQRTRCIYCGEALPVTLFAG